MGVADLCTMYLDAWDRTEGEAWRCGELDKADSRNPSLRLTGRGCRWGRGRWQTSGCSAQDPGACGCRGLPAGCAGPAALECCAAGGQVCGWATVC